MGELPESLFPFDTIRKEQMEFADDVDHALKSASDLIAHAPTGLGKTAAALSPALKFAMEKEKTIFFLTSRHTQHAIAVETLQNIRAKHGISFHCADLIGKKHMCLVPGVTNLFSGEFADYCRKAREENACEFFNNTKENNKLKAEARVLLSDLKRQGPLQVEEVKSQSSNCRMCPHEMGISLARDASVIIADYFYVFNPKIFSGFLAKTGKSIEDCIIIVDEAHNLPERIRNLMTQRLSTNILNRAAREAKKNHFHELSSTLTAIQELVEKMGANVDKEKPVSREALVSSLKTVANVTELIPDLQFAADAVRLNQKASLMGSVANFLEAWYEDDYGFVRYLEVSNADKRRNVILNYKCLDPSLISKSIITEAHSTIMMSGTLVPTEMYGDILGFNDSTVHKAYGNPFPEENRLNMIIPKTSTRYATRSEEQYKNIAEVVADVVNRVPGNSAVFFPSYHLRDNVNKYLGPKSTKTTFLESPGLTNLEKAELLERFKAYHKSGAVLLGVAGGSFGEGVDLPGDYLKAVIIVGLPLKQPNIEAKALIKYYDELFKRGWDYGYTFPALNQVMQAAGRCIRSKTDKGIIVFLDERFAWQNYMRCFPRDWNVKITGLYKDRVDEFFGLVTPKL